MAVSFIGGGNWRKPPICRKSRDKLYHIMLYRVHLACAGFELTTLVVIGTDYTGSCKSNYHTITTSTAPNKKYDTWRTSQLQHSSRINGQYYWICLNLCVLHNLFRIIRSFLDSYWSSKLKQLNTVWKYLLEKFTYAR